MQVAAKRIAITTGGGDAPGLNAVIRAVVLSAESLGWACFGIRDSFNGLLAPSKCLGDPIVSLSPMTVHDIGHLGGTILGSTNRGDPLHYPVPRGDGSFMELDLSSELVHLCRQHGFDALVMIGGDASMTIADSLHRKGLHVIGVPKTIDNDLDGTVQAFGFDTAVNFATECLDRLHTTADSQHRILVVETMGRHAGWIALHAGMAGGAHAILVPEIPFDIGVVANAIHAREAHGWRHSILVVAEGALPCGGQSTLLETAGAGRAERLGGIGAWVEARLCEQTGKECRSVVLGHLLRGGSPSAFDRVVAARFGAAAVQVLAAGQSGLMVCLEGQDIGVVPLAKVAGRSRHVPVDGDTVRTARALGICLGERPGLDI